MRQVEDIFIPYLDKEIVAFSSSIARSRRGGAVKENEFNMSIDLVSRDKRKQSNSELIKEWEQKLGELSGFMNLSFAAPRFGQASGSAIDIIIQESNDSIRNNVAQEILSFLQRMPSLKNQEIEAELVFPQNVISIDRNLAERLGVSISTLASSLRTILSGNNVYDIIMNDKEIQVMLTIDDGLKKNIDSVLAIPVQNKQNYLIPLYKLVTLTKNTTPNTIPKLDSKRVLHVYADLAAADTEDRPPVQPVAQTTGSASEGTTRPADQSTSEAENRASEAHTAAAALEMLELPETMTPLEIADYLEKNLFGGLMQKYPTTEVSFGGEIADSREAGSDFEYAIIIAVLLIYVILALSLNSVYKPFIILFAIPFGCVGIIFALQIHGIFIYGFFSAVGALGLAGVVVNDSIVLLDKLEKEYHNPDHGSTPIIKVANITKTRLRAVLLTTITTVAGLLPTAYGVFGYDSMLSEMMLTMAWGLIFGTVITLVLVPAIYCSIKEFGLRTKKKEGK